MEPEDYPSARSRTKSNSSLHESENLRTININNRACDGEQCSIDFRRRAKDNQIVTSKYTLWNFIPKNLFEQFRRIANFYFLCIAVIQVTTDSPVNPITVLLPLFFVILTTAIKQGYEDILRHRMDQVVNRAMVSIILRNKLHDVASEAISLGDIVRVENNCEVPCDLVLLHSSTPEGKCSLTTANLDGETALKVRDAFPQTQIYSTPRELGDIEGVIRCQQPHTDLYEFVGTIELHAGPEGRISSQLFSLGPHNLLLRGSRLRNTKYVYGVAVYIGPETKLALNSRLTSSKFSGIEQKINEYLIVFALVLLLMATSCSFIQLLDPELFWYFDPLLDYHTPTYGAELMEQFLSFFAIFNYLIPISLYVSMEVVKFIGSRALVNDEELHCRETDERLVCNSSDLNEVLGQVEYLFSDKTGTLTENVMRFKACSIDGEIFEMVGNSIQSTDSRDSSAIISDPRVNEFFVSLCICHTVNVVTSKDGADFELSYEADSPDEKALVEISPKFNVTLVGSGDQHCEIKLGEKLERYEKLLVFPFDSTRKRMSVIAKDPQGNILMITKGADSAFDDRISSGQIKETYNHIGLYANLGLRTLVVCKKNMTSDEFESLKQEYREASLAMTHRKDKIAKVCDNYERNYTLLGATAIEDRLQEGVPETISQLKAAGIKIWVLTGDKVETAISVAYSCKLLEEKFIQLALVHQPDTEACRESLEAHLKTIKDTSNDPYRLGPPIQFAFIADGGSLFMAMKDHKETLHQLYLKCTVVLCCRMSPIQKAEVVHMIKASLEKPVTAAIGDGANDVSMLQEADIGFGLMGKEGRQAVASSDFAFAKFRFLKRVLLVHGHYSYVRIAILIQYFFYKNVAFVTPQLLFAFYNAFSAQTLYHSLMLMLYNMIFTAFPILIFGIEERNIPEEILERNPHVYKKNTHNAKMSYFEFTKWFTNGLYHGFVAFFGPLYIMNLVNPNYDENIQTLYSLGTMIFHWIVAIVNIKLLIISQNWTRYYILTGISSVIGVVLFCLIFNFMERSIIADELHAIYTPIIKSPAFWLAFFVIIPIAVIPDILKQMIYNSWSRYKYFEERPSRSTIGNILNLRKDKPTPKTPAFRKFFPKR